MKLMLDINIPTSEEKISYKNKMLLIGSCFTEEIGQRLKHVKFNLLQNPNGILYDPLSMSKSIDSYIENKVYAEDYLFYNNELWHSWQHHSRFSGINKEEVLQHINSSQKQAHEYLKEANWLILTPGTSFYYTLLEKEESVANCHKVPASSFRQAMLTSGEIIEQLTKTFEKLRSFNPKLNIIFTVSPVRHIRQGIVENNLSKSRLIDAIHSLIDANPHLPISYFPAYELVIDVLRDHRFYERDLAHPNSLAADFVFEKFTQAYLDMESQSAMEEVSKWLQAESHRPFNTDTSAYSRFKDMQADKLEEMKKRFPFVSW
jgi:hypothetical protein